MLHSGTLSWRGEAHGYLIFERADADAQDLAGRSQLRGWGVLAALRDAARGLAELHRLGIVHQDLKPSNLLYFRAQGFKIGDLGRAASRVSWGPFAHHWIVGDRSHAPPELHYQTGSLGWKTRGLRTDAWLLGSLAVALLLGGSMTSLAAGPKPGPQPDLDAYSPRRWRGRVQGVTRALERSLADQIGRSPARRVAQLVNALCEPNPTKRIINAGFVARTLQDECRRMG